MPGKRRSLEDGLKDTPDPRSVSEQERDFVYRHNNSAEDQTTSHSTEATVSKSTKNSSLREAMKASPHTNGRIPIGVRLHPVVHESLQKVSLLRKLRKKQPQTIQDITDQAIIEWLERQPDIDQTR